MPLGLEGTFNIGTTSMLATSHEAKKPTGYGRFFSSTKACINSPRSAAIAITLILHLLVLWGSIHSQSLHPVDSITPHLQYIELPRVEQVVQFRAPEPPVINPAAPIITLQPLSGLTIQADPLTPQELKELLGGDDYSLQHDTAAIANNVFHPGMRKRLTEEANKPVLARVEDRGLETYIDPSGATIVVSANGSCLSSPATKIGEPRNWYMVTCAGKNESEKTMDRINESINDK